MFTQDLKNLQNFICVLKTSEIKHKVLFLWFVWNEPLIRCSRWDRRISFIVTLSLECVLWTNAWAPPPSRCLSSVVRRKSVAVRIIDHEEYDKQASFYVELQAPCWNQRRWTGVKRHLHLSDDLWPFLHLALFSSFVQFTPVAVAPPLQRHQTSCWSELLLEEF